MIQKMANHSMFPEELYNLTQLADVTLAAGKLSTTNIQLNRDGKSEDASKSDSEKAPILDVVSGQKMQRKNESAAHGGEGATFPQDGGYITDIEMDRRIGDTIITHSANIIKLVKNSYNGAFKKSNFEQRQSSFSSSEDDSTFNYSHKIFDKRKSRKLCYQSDDSEFMHDHKREDETEDSLLSTSETESSINDFTIRNKSSESIGTNEDVHVCPECGKKYSTSSNLARHRQTHRSPLDKKARHCPHCDKVYVSMPAFSMHVRTHNQGCECPHCGKRFSRPWLLQGHIRTHTGEKPFQCSICTKAFADKSNLRAHVQTHSNTKPHICTRCGKAFALKSYLYKHEESSCIRNYTKEKEKGKCRTDSAGCKTAVAKKIRKSSSGGGIAFSNLNRSRNDESEMGSCHNEPIDDRECIIHDAGSKKSYMDLKIPKAEIEQYPRISVIRNALSPPSNYEACQFAKCYQEKPMDFSPKNKYKHDCSSDGNLMDISRSYATIVV